MKINNKENKNSKKENETSICQTGKKSKRIGAAKKEMSGYNISLETLNSIEIDDFDN